MCLLPNKVNNCMGTSTFLLKISFNKIRSFWSNSYIDSEIFNWVYTTSIDNNIDILRIRLAKISDESRLKSLSGIFHNKWYFKTGNQIDDTIIAFFHKVNNAFTREQQEAILKENGEMLLVYFEPHLFE